VTSKSRSSLPLVAGVASLALLWPINASAQYHGHPHGGSVHGAVVVGAPYYRPYYYRPYYYRPYWFGIGFGYGYGYPYPYPYAWYPPYPYYYGYYDNTGSARLEVTPREAQVYVDGSFVGTVDDFDGTFQRLNLEPGRHDLALYVEGYRTVHQPVLFRRGTTLKITVAMQPLGPGETNEKPAPDSNRVPPPAYTARPGGHMPAPAGPPPDERGRAPVPVNRGDRDPAFGTLALRVQPGDAEVVIDGERWDSPEGGSRLLVQLTEGSHRVEVRKRGFRLYSSTVRVRRGETETLNVSLGEGSYPASPAVARRVVSTSLR
jgi:hypothetical protein